jgi:hypothetical protein
MNNWSICWFFTYIFTGDLIFKGLTARRFYKSFGVKGLIMVVILLWVLAWYTCVSEASETTFPVKCMFFTFETEVFVFQFCYLHQIHQYIK